MSQQHLGGFTVLQPIRPPSHRALYAGILTALVIMVLCGSYYPFEARQTAISETVARFLDFSTLEGQRFSLLDFASNMFLFVPLGFLLAGVLWPRHGGFVWRFGSGSAAFVATVFGCMALSLCKEIGQILFQDRIVAQLDLLANCLGANLGLAIWIGYGEWVDGLLARVPRIEGRLGLANRALVIGVLLFIAARFFPFDFTMRPSELARKFHRGDVVFSLFGDAGGQDRLRELLEAISLLFLYGGVGAVAMLAWTQPGRRRGALESALVGFGLVIVLELAQILVLSRRSDALSLLLGGIGVVGGVGAVVLFTKREAPPPPSTSRAKSRRWALLGALAWIAGMLAWSWWPFDFNMDRERGRLLIEQIRAAPFTLGPLAPAIVLAFVALPLGVLLRHAWPPSSGASARREALVAAFLLGVVGLILIAAEAVQILLPGQVPSLIHVVLGLLGAGAGIAVSGLILGGEQDETPDLVTFTGDLSGGIAAGAFASQGDLASVSAGGASASMSAAATGAASGSAAATGASGATSAARPEKQARSLLVDMVRTTLERKDEPVMTGDTTPIDLGEESADDSASDLLGNLDETQADLVGDEDGLSGPPPVRVRNKKKELGDTTIEEEMVPPDAVGAVRRGGPSVPSSFGDVTVEIDEDDDDATKGVGERAADRQPSAPRSGKPVDAESAVSDDGRPDLVTIRDLSDDVPGDDEDTRPELELYATAAVASRRTVEPSDDDDETKGVEVEKAAKAERPPSSEDEETGPIELARRRPDASDGDLDDTAAVAAEDTGGDRPIAREEQDTGPIELTRRRPEASDDDDETGVEGDLGDGDATGPLELANRRPASAAPDELDDDDDDDTSSFAPGEAYIPSIEDDETGPIELARKIDTSTSGEIEVAAGRGGEDERPREEEDTGRFEEDDLEETGETPADAVSGPAPEAPDRADEDTGPFELAERLAAVTDEAEEAAVVTDVDREAAALAEDDTGPIELERRRERPDESGELDTEEDEEAAVADVDREAAALADDETGPIELERRRERPDESGELDTEEDVEEARDPVDDDTDDDADVDDDEGPEVQPGKASRAKSDRWTIGGQPLELGTPAEGTPAAPTEAQSVVVTWGGHFREEEAAPPRPDDAPEESDGEPDESPKVQPGRARRAKSDRWTLGGQPLEDGTPTEGTFAPSGGPPKVVVTWDKQLLGDEEGDEAGADDAAPDRPDDEPEGEPGDDEPAGGASDNAARD